MVFDAIGGLDLAISVRGVYNTQKFGSAVNLSPSAQPGAISVPTERALMLSMFPMKRIEFSNIKGEEIPAPAIVNIFLSAVETTAKFKNETIKTAFLTQVAQAPTRVRRFR